MVIRCLELEGMLKEIRTFELLKNCSLYTVVTWVDTKKAIVSQLTDIKKVIAFEFVLSSRLFGLIFN